MPQTYRVLILEDDADLAEELRLKLAQLGYTVSGVTGTGSEALALAHAQRPDVALVDIVLPGELDGIQVAARFLQMGIPVVYLTAYADDALLDRAKVTEPYGYIVKPYNERELHANLAMALFKADAERQIIERNQLYATLFSFCEAVLGADSQGRILLVNEAATHLLNQPHEALIGRDIAEVLQLKDLRTGRLVTSELLYTLETEHMLRRDGLSLHTADGETIDVAIGASRILTPEGERLGYAVLILDTTERNHMQAELYKLSTAAEQTADAVMITNPQGEIDYVNKSFEAMTGYTRKEMMGAKPSILRSGYHESTFYQAMWETILSGEPFREVFINRKKDGSIYYEEKTITPLRNATGTIIHFLSVGSDITRRLQTEERLNYLATHDVQTDLPNRVLFHDRLDQALLHTLKAGRTVGVLFLNIDRLKVINETLGHSVGDACLKEIAQRLSACLRPGDTAARFGGDEFILLLDNVASVDDVSLVTRRILDAIAAPMQLEGRELFVTASVGISLAPQDATTREDLVREAEAAMNRTKAEGKNRYQFFTPDMNARAFERLNMETALRHALDRGEFRLHYQPIVALADNQITGFEALLRWQHPELGLVMPTDFIPLLEETGVILQVGMWVLETACVQQVVWEKESGKPITMAVNVSPVQLQQDNLMLHMQAALQASQIRADRLFLEVTEGVLMKQIDKSVIMLRELAGWGVNIAIDDFGTGYSSLSYLTRLPVNTLKVDRSFVHDVPGNIHNAKVTQGIVALGHSLGMRTVGEGVETTIQEQFLRELGCGYAQGFLFGKAMPPAEGSALLAGAG
ncbi:MAG: EAL domain-containing protein [Pseudomonadota bacterium]